MSVVSGVGPLRKLLSRKPDQRRDRVPPHLKEQFLEGTRNPCLILHEYCQITRLNVDYDECDPPDVPGMQICWAMRAVINGAVFPLGLGRNKKEAKQDAAEKALMSLFEIQSVFTGGTSSHVGGVSDTGSLAYHDFVPVENGANALDLTLTSIDLPCTNFQDKVLKFLDSAEVAGSLAGVDDCDRSSSRSLEEFNNVLHSTCTAGLQNSDDDTPSLSSQHTIGCQVLSPQLCLKHTNGVAKPQSPLKSPPPIKCRYSGESLHDIMTSLFLKKRDEVMQQLRNNHSSVKEKDLSGNWAALVLQSNAGSSRPGHVIALASGSGCFDVSAWPATYSGTFIHDSHAVVVLRRCLVRYLYIELMRHLDGGLSGGASIFKDRPEDNGRWSVKEDIKFRIVLNTLPCGAAYNCCAKNVRHEASAEESCSKVSTSSATEVVTKSRSDLLRDKIAVMKANKKAAMGTPAVATSACGKDQCGDTFPTTGDQSNDDSLQFKISPSSSCGSSAVANFVNFMSCSDKVLRWNYLGWEGSLLGSFINPIFMSSVTFSHSSPTSFDKASISQALVQRSFQHIDSELIGRIPSSFKTAPSLEIGQPSRSFSSISDSTPVCCTTQREDSNRLSLNWTIHDQAVELVVPQQGTVSPLSPFQLPNTKQGTLSHSRLCKKAFLNRFVNHVKNTQQSTPNLDTEVTNKFDTYRAAKKSALSAPMHYSRTRNAFLETIGCSNSNRPSKDIHRENSSRENSRKGFWSCSKMKNVAVNF